VSGPEGRDQSDVRLSLVLQRAAQVIRSQKARLLRDFDLTGPQFAALFILAGTAQASAAQLARACQVTPQSMATVLENLEAKGLIVRQLSALHQRVRETRLTAEGKRTLAEADQAVLTLERRLAAAFDAEELAALRESLERAAVALATPED
jgi:DNA-binding MarR family transcriptional regulator